MNKLLKAIVVAILTIIISCQYTIISNAANTKLPLITFKTSTTKINPKDEIKVYLYYGEKETYEGGIAYIEGNIEYDKNILEPIITNGSAYNDWIVGYNEADGKLSLERNDLVTDAQEVAEITFKVKEKVTAKETSISIKNVAIANIENDDMIKVKDAELKFTINGSSSTENKNENTNKNTNTNTNKNENETKNTTNNTTKNENTNKNENKNTTKNEGTSGNSSNGSSSNGGTSGGSSSTDSTQKSGSLPYTGVIQWGITAIIVVGIIGLVSYKKYEKYKNV